MELGTERSVATGPREWPRVVALVGVVLITSIFVHPGVVVGVPLALLLAGRGLGNTLSAAVVALVVLIVAGGREGSADGLWYAERAWAVLLAGWFVAVGLWAPSWRLTSRALAAATGAAAVVAGFFAVRVGSWTALDGAVARSMQGEVETTMSVIQAITGQGALPPDMVEVAQRMAEVQLSVFPALLGIESLAALGVAWWARSRLLGDRDQGLAPLRDFRFNDHLVWLLVVGMVLMLTQSGAALGRVGSNVLVLMGALYAMRGAAVFVFVSGGMSLFSSLLVAVLLAIAPSVILGTAALIGIGDTWLDLRARTADQAV